MNFCAAAGSSQAVAFATLARPHPYRRFVRFDKGVTPSHSTGLLTFVETTTFTRLVADVVSDDDYAEFQRELSRHPEQGDLLKGCGGVRKIRLAARGKGKSGGARVIYLYLRHRERIYLLYLFTKGDAANLSADGKKIMRELAQQIRRETTS
jgi:hypothetical protein